MINKVIIPVAGLGTRFLPATKAQPKEMLPIIDKPVIQYLVEEAVAAGMTEVIFVTGRGKRAIEDHFDFSPELESALLAKGQQDIFKTVRSISQLARFFYVRQNSSRGIGDAVLQVRPLIDKETVAVMSGDDVIETNSAPPALKQLLRIYERYHAPVVALVKVPRSEVRQYGIIAGTEITPRVWKITGMVEKPTLDRTPSNLAIVVKYILTPPIFDCLEKIKPAAGGEIFLTPAIDAFIKGGGEFYGYEVRGTWYDCGSKIGLLKATVDLALRHPELKTEFRRYLTALVKK
ncbi:MAG: UTP--glucose-1-phosphate uridylyltransferase [Patescibacteria group bacterium]